MNVCRCFWLQYYFRRSVVNLVKVIMGLKGSGKTKRLIELVTRSIEEESGDVICIEKGKNLTYDIPYRARLIHASDYQFGSYEFFKGFLSGLYAGNYDITQIYIDNFFKIVNDSDYEAAAEFLAWLDTWGERENIKFTISATADPATVGDNIKKYFI